MEIGNKQIMAVIADPKDFDNRSGTWLERLIFNHRMFVIVACAAVTVLLAFVAASRLTLNASFERMLPASQPYI